MRQGDHLVIQTKLIPPIRESRLVTRDRLFTRISNSTDSNLVVVKAPAGYGKTTFASQWFTKLDPATDLAGWLSLDAADNDLARFFTYLVAALRLRASDFGATVLAQLTAGVRPSAASLKGAFLNEVETVAKRVNIVLDDFQLLTHSRVIDVIGEIICNAPANLCLVILSREMPRLPLGRLRALGRVVEISSSDLRFSKVEIGSFMSIAGHNGLSSSQLHTLGERTEGWAVGLQLASISLSNSIHVEELIASFSGKFSDVADFLAEDVVQRQTPEIREFLLHTSILERLSPSLCDAITKKNNGRRMLDLVESKSLFLFSLDNEREWYRYHHLFSEFLRKTLNIEQQHLIKQLHARASDWFATHDFIEEAIQHALIGQDMDRAVHLLEQICDDLFYSGRLSTLAEWFNQIPQTHLPKCPRTLLDQAWFEILEWKFSVAKQKIDNVHTILEEKKKVGDSEFEISLLRSLLRHREMMYEMFRDNMPRAKQLCEEMLQDFPVADPYLKGNLYTCLIYAQREMFDFSDVDRYDARALKLYEEANSRFVLIWHNSILGPTELERGDLDRAEETLTQGRSIACDISGELSPLAAMPGILLAEVLYERNQLDETDALLKQYLPLADQIGFVDQLISGYVCRARRLMATGADAEAKKVLREAEMLAIKQRFSRLHEKINAEIIRQALLTRDLEKANRMFLDLFGETDETAFYPLGCVTSIDATRALTWCRIARLEGLMNQAAAVCRKWIRFTKNRKSVRTTIRFQVQLAYILQQRGENRASLRALREALTAAMSAGFIRTIIDEMEDNVTLLSQFIEAQQPNDDPVLEYANQLAEIITAESGKYVPVLRPSVETLNSEPLSKREIEILQRVANGLSNSEIANALSLTEGSVKWHLQQIYDKVGMRRRAKAVQRARELGFIR